MLQKKYYKNKVKFIKLNLKYRKDLTKSEELEFKCSVTKINSF